MTDVYWNRRRGLWSVREGGRVIGHRRDVLMGDVELVVREAAVLRMRARRQREVCAWAQGELSGIVDHPDAPELPTCGAARIRFTPFSRADFHTERGEPVRWCHMLYLDPHGAAWGWSCR
ncbi:hypothetical protein OKC48_23775 [Methylorubrum extorquens]|uniref:hypothetical protein n=1 Tax=Methylorubrum extorquens TaxID=408 RepID=UPI0022377037|nr:hypothetical protein [Methylorubrum extorquens]UYW26252.1 hypothetical protein OKC48_23775 [Methylorubrum extorquens]